LAKGFPVPYFEPDLLEESVRSTVAADFAGFLTSAPAGPGAGDAFSKLSSLVSDEVASAIGFLPDPSDSAADILTKMCVRCHSDEVDVALAPRRSKFNALALDRLNAAEARKIIERIRLPRSSPELMPPLLAGELPDWARDRVEELLRER
jgi:hypothetical protein